MKCEICGSHLSHAYSDERGDFGPMECSNSSCEDDYIENLVDEIKEWLEKNPDALECDDDELHDTICDEFEPFEWVNVDSIVEELRNV